MFFVHETLHEYMLTVNWYNIPPTLNKVLAHGKDIAEATPMPVSWTSEEGSESNTKFNRLMDISHPVIVSHSKEKKKPQAYIPEDMAGFFKNMSEVVEHDINIVPQINISLCEDEPNSE